MTITPFAAIEQSINAEVLANLANAAATFGGAQVPVIFDNSYAQAMAGMVEASMPSCQAATADVAALVQGSTLTINAMSYRVTEVHPDGTGLTTLLLELAA